MFKIGLNHLFFHWKGILILSLLNRMPCVPCVQRGLRVHVHLSMCQNRSNFSFMRTNVPINLSTFQHAKRVPIFQLGAPTCQRRVNFSTSPAKRSVNFSTSPDKRRANFSKVNFFQFLNFSIMLNICKFQEYLGKSRKFISRNKTLRK